MLVSLAVREESHSAAGTGSVQVMADSDWWYDLTTHAAVQDSRAGKVANRLGPYASREEAERALDKVAERNEEAEAQDRWGDED